MILAGDIGGTKTVMALFEGSADGLNLVREEVYPSRKYPTFDEILGDFLSKGTDARPRTACFGIAGAVIDGKVHTTNLPWSLEEGALAETAKVSRAKLLNDLEAAAFGMIYLRPDELVSLNPSAPARRHGNAGVIAAGTGLGEAILYWDGSQYHPIASEGGHGDFGPRNDLEIELLQYLREQFGSHVSYERVLSGPGLGNVYRFLRDRGHYPEAPAVAEALETGDSNATISKLGIEGSDPLSAAAVDLFCSLYGAEAGNLALRSVSVGGIFLGGGIAPKMLPALRRGEFMRSFTAKGRFSQFLTSVEVNVALNMRAPLLGAAYYSLRL